MLQENLESTHPVRHIEAAYEAPTYNLVVADYHTYFADPAKILRHDNTICEPTSKGVPGK